MSDPGFIAPMLATTAEGPVEGEGWVYERWRGSDTIALWPTERWWPSMATPPASPGFSSGRA